jgi:hypothetical protein
VDNFNKGTIAVEKRPALHFVLWRTFFNYKWQSNIHCVQTCSVWDYKFLVNGIQRKNSIWLKYLLLATRLAFYITQMRDKYEKDVPKVRGEVCGIILFRMRDTSLAVFHPQHRHLSRIPKLRDWSIFQHEDG